MTTSFEVSPAEQHWLVLPHRITLASGGCRLQQIRLWHDPYREGDIKSALVHFPDR
jgi:hypothetical protein